MSAARTITNMGAAVALVDGKVKLSGLDRLPAEVAARVVEVARARRDELRRELDPTGLGWLPGPPDDADPAFPSWWAAFDLQDIGRCFGVRIVRAGERVLAVYPPGLDPELVDATSEVLADARLFLSANLDKLPVLAPTEAVAAIKEIMRAHKSLRFCRGEAGSRWPIYPRQWTAGQRATVQSLWFATGDALDRDDFMEVDQ